MPAPAITGGYTAIPTSLLTSQTVFPAGGVDGVTTVFFSGTTSGAYSAPNVVSGQYQQGEMDFTGALDISALDRALVWNFTPATQENRSETPDTPQARGVSLLLRDGSDNWAQFVVSGNGATWDENPTVTLSRPAPIYASSATTQRASSGTLDLTNITNVYPLLFGQRALSPRFGPEELGYLDPFVITQGEVGAPGTIKDVSDAAAAEIRFLFARSGDVDAFMYQLCVPMIVGDGTTETHFELVGLSIMWRSAVRDFLGNDQHRHFGDNTLGITTDMGASGGFAIDGCVINSNTPWHLRLGQTTGAAVSIDDTQFINAGEVVLGPTVTANGAAFRQCGVAQVKGAAISSCTFRNYKGGTGARIDPGTVLTGVVFSTQTAADHAIEIDQAGDYTISGVTFTGHTTDIDVTATSGVVNISVSGGTSPTFQTAGATVNILNQISLTLTANVSLIGAEIRIYDNDVAGNYGTELAGVEASASADFSFSAEAGNAVVIQVMAAGFVEYAQAVTLPATSQPISIILETDNNA